MIEEVDEPKEAKKRHKNLFNSNGLQVFDQYGDEYDDE
jgi:hypothetical protein